MQISSIQNVEQIQSLLKISDSSNSTETAVSSFSEIFQNALNNVSETNTTVQQNIAELVAGETDDLHTVAIDLTKAELAVEMLVQVRNKALDAYNEIMRISL